MHSLRNQNFFHNPIRGVKGSMKAMVKRQQEQKYSTRVKKLQEKLLLNKSTVLCRDNFAACVLSEIESNR